MWPPAWLWPPRNRRRAFTIIELMSVVIILSIATILAYPRYQSSVDKAKNAKAIGELENMNAELLGYMSTNDSAAASLADIGRADLLDPWGNPYRYLRFGEFRENRRGRVLPPGARRDRFMVPVNTHWDLYSMGKNGQTRPGLNTREGRDDLIVIHDGDYVGLAGMF